MSGGYRADKWRVRMLDAICVAIACGFLLGTVLYAVACDRI